MTRPTALGPFDDHPVHQTTRPIHQPVDGSAGFVERYMFTACPADADQLLCATVGLLPNLRQTDAALLHTRSGSTTAVRAVAGFESGDPIGVGPFDLRVARPLERLELDVDAPDLGARAAGVFEADSPLHPEPLLVRAELSGRTELTTAVQTGTWSGRSTLAEARWEAEGWTAVRIRSWGVVPVDDPDVPVEHLTSLPHRYGLRVTAVFPHLSVHAVSHEDPAGSPWVRAGLVRRGPGPWLEASHATITPAWSERRLRSIEVSIDTADGGRLAVSTVPGTSCSLAPAGFLGGDWPHGIRRGPARGLLRSAALPGGLSDSHCIHVGPAWMDGGEGVAVVEQQTLGPHLPSGLAGFAGGHA